jgi:hypothetical protein
MPWYAWAIIGLYAISSVATVAYIGRPREPITPLVAILALIINGLAIWGTVALAPTDVPVALAPALRAAGTLSPGVRPHALRAAGPPGRPLTGPLH